MNTWDHITSYLPQPQQASLRAANFSLAIEDSTGVTPDDLANNNSAPLNKTVLAQAVEDLTLKTKQ